MNTAPNAHTVEVSYRLDGVLTMFRTDIVIDDWHVREGHTFSYLYREAYRLATHPIGWASENITEFTVRKV